MGIVQLMHSHFDDRVRQTPIELAQEPSFDLDLRRLKSKRTERTCFPTTFSLPTRDVDEDIGRNEELGWIGISGVGTSKLGCVEGLPPFLRCQPSVPVKISIQ